uniref:L1 transposable element RRM domain-containing protein n=1 Tax=Phocoena sinus TaxID=42100 RepID=A0A8C9CXS9_PHOSS
MIVKMIQNLGNRIDKMQETFNKDLEELKMKQTMMNNTINEMKNTLDGINSRITEAEEWISDLEDKIVEITTAEQNKEKRTEDTLRDLWDNIKHMNIQIIGVPEEEEKKKGTEKIFEEIIVENFPNMGKEIVNQVQEAQRVPYRINPRRNRPRHILIKL